MLEFAWVSDDHAGGPIMRRKLLVLPVLVAGMVGLTYAQPPGGGFPGGGFPGGGPGGGGERGGGRMFGRGGGGGGQADPERIWQFMAKGQASINLNDPANAMIKSRMERDGTPIPPNGVLTKEQFSANFQSSMQKRMASSGQPGASPMQFQSTSPGGGPPQGGGGGGPGGGGFGGGRGGFDPSSMSNEQLQGMMRRDDADGDGRISAAEASRARSDSLRDGFAQYDTNRDGFIDVTEYRTYLTIRVQQRQSERGQNQPPGGGNGATGGQVPQFQQPPGQPNSGQPHSGQPANDEPARPEVLRYGKLPKGAPSWMLAPSSANSAGLDADRDGQIGLYEWRRAGKKTSEFVDMDLNGDGYLTHTEWKAYHERLAEKQKAEDPDAPTPMVITPGGSSNGGDRGTKGGDRGPKWDRGQKGERSPKGEGKGPRRNPFSNGSKGG